MMDIVDAQLHMGRGGIGGTLEAMDALGIRSVLIDEFWGAWDSPDPTHIKPGHLLANGAWRAEWPTAGEAAALYPHRFSYVVRIDRRDPDLEALMRVVASSPGARGFRLQPVWTIEEAALLVDGAYDPLLAVAEELGLPVGWFVPGHVELLLPYIRRYPRLTFVIDHCGMGFATIPPGRDAAQVDRVCAPAYFDTVLAMAAEPNVILKWSHGQHFFGVTDYPYAGLRPLLRRAIDAFGADRLMWASDKTVMFGHSWGDLLYALRDAPDLTDVEKGWILGGTARRVFGWQVPPPEPSRPDQQ